MDNIIQNISNVGFPICCVLMLGYILICVVKYAAETIKTIEARQREDSDKFTKAINELNLTLTKFLERLDTDAMDKR